LRGAAPSRTALASLLDALDRVTADRRETSRDPRAELLDRLREMGDSTGTGRLLPYLRDFDPAIASRAAVVLTEWTGRSYTPSPPRVATADTGLARLAGGGPIRLRITMAPVSGGGVFVVRLDPGTATATVARVLKLIGRRYYDGLTWHRVVANFVVQGGSPGMNEYAGDALFMRDELGLPSHRRGTLGISTRGRDTGDAQLFINLVDNYRLDHDYTVFAEVESGISTVDDILEGDTIAHIERIP
jgi:cyclophilin family peptidyl-prolyl cis-trans isomerase